MRAECVLEVAGRGCSPGSNGGDNNPFEPNSNKSAFTHNMQCSKMLIRTDARLCISTQRLLHVVAVVIGTVRQVYAHSVTQENRGRDAAQRTCSTERQKQRLLLHDEARKRTCVR